MIQTVLGAIKPEELGRTLTHEHLLYDLRIGEEAYEKYKGKPEYSFMFEPLSLETRSWVRYYKAWILDNCVVMDEELVRDELQLFANAGGGAICDLSSIGIYRDPEVDVRLSKATGLHIVKGTGVYVESVHPAEFASMSDKEIAKVFIKELNEGVGDSGVRCGVIGEMGISLFREPEQRAMRAAAIAHCATDAAVTVHLDYYECGVAEAVRILLDGGVDPTRIVLGHSDRWHDKLDTLKPYLDKGINIEFDTFGTDYVLDYSVYYPNDLSRIIGLRKLCDMGYTNQLCMSHDICSKGQLIKYGGGGYVHMLNHIVPTMRALGFKDAEIDQITVKNPARILNKRD